MTSEAFRPGCGLTTRPTLVDDAWHPRLAHPAAWAPFVVVGEGGGCARHPGCDRASVVDVPLEFEERHRHVAAKAGELHQPPDAYVRAGVKELLARAGEAD